MKSTLKIVLFLLAIAAVFLFSFGFEGMDRGIPLLPPLVAIGFSFITKNVIFSLFCGIYVGALALIEIQKFSDFLPALFAASIRVGDTYVVQAVADSDHAANILFILITGGMVGVITRSGGLTDIVVRASVFAKTAVRAQFMTTFMGIAIFIDDYANTLIVGNTMRPLTDRYRVSREKLAFIVDATAAPIASIALISTWIAYEVGLIDEALKTIGSPENAYLIFIDSLPYRFYAILIILFIFLSTWMKRDFGPMLKAERRARQTGEVLRAGSHPLTSKELTEMTVASETPQRWYNAVIPIVVMILTVFIGLYVDGWNAIAQVSGTAAAKAAGLREILGNSNPFLVLMWGAMFSAITAILLVVWQKICSLDEALRVWVEGVKSVVLAIVILTLAWALSGVIKELHTADVLIELGINFLKPTLFPALVFIFASIMAFATGTSWGTMAILFPLVIPLLHKLSLASGMPPETFIMLLNATTGAILTGAILGDHSSPISDTTVMSSMCSAVDHMDHVRTQLPYAVVVGSVALVFGYLPAGFGLNPYLMMAIGTAILFGILKFFGKDPEERQAA